MYTTNYVILKMTTLLRVNYKDLIIKINTGLESNAIQFKYFIIFINIIITNWEQ